MDDFQRVAQCKAVFHVNRCPAVFVHRADLADKLALLGDGVAVEVVLVFLRLVAFQKAAGVAAVGQAFEFGEQAVIEGAAGHGVVDGFAVGLGDAGDVIHGFGAAFHFQAVHADFGELGDLFDGAQVFGVHNISTVLVFHNRHEFAGAVALFNQEDFVGGGVAFLAVDAFKGGVGFFLGCLKIEAAQ